MPIATESVQRNLEQIRNDLTGLSNRNPGALPRFRAHMRGLLGDIWRRVASGDSAAPGEAARGLAGFEDFVARHRPADADPLAVAALELEAHAEGLAVGADIAAHAAAERRIVDPTLAELEQQILLVLLDKLKDYRRRGQVHEDLRAMFGVSPSPQYVGQKLEDLHDLGLLTCLRRPAQGSANAAFYALSDQGERLARGLEVEPVWNPWLLDAQPLRGLRQPHGAGVVVTFCTEHMSPTLGWLTLRTAEAWFKRGLKFQQIDAGFNALLGNKSDPEPASVLVLDLDPDRAAMAPRRSDSSLLGLALEWEQQAPRERARWLAGALSPRSDRLHRLREEGTHTLAYLSVSGFAEDCSAIRPALEPQLRRLCRLALAPDNPGSFLAEVRKTLCEQWRLVIVRAPPRPLDALLYCATAVLPDAVLSDEETSVEFLHVIEKVKDKSRFPPQLVHLNLPPEAHDNPQMAAEDPQQWFAQHRRRWSIPGSTPLQLEQSSE